MAMDNAQSAYMRAYDKAVEMLHGWYDEYKDGDEKSLRELLWTKYRDNGLDPDGKFIKTMYGVDCTADALISIYRICQMEPETKDIVSVYSRYRKMPMFYFPCEQGGINQSRSRAFGDRIDYTLYDLSVYFKEERSDHCRLKKAFDKPMTGKWLQGIGSFEGLIDLYDVRGIFTDAEYRVINLDTGELISGYPEPDVKLWDWSQGFYENVKAKMDEWYQRAGVE